MMLTVKPIGFLESSRTWRLSIKRKTSRTTWFTSTMPMYAALTPKTRCSLSCRRLLTPLCPPMASLTTGSTNQVLWPRPTTLINNSQLNLLINNSIRVKVRINIKLKLSFPLCLINRQNNTPLSLSNRGWALRLPTTTNNSYLASPQVGEDTKIPLKSLRNHPISLELVKISEPIKAVATDNNLLDSLKLVMDNANKTNNKTSTSELLRTLLLPSLEPECLTTAAPILPLQIRQQEMEQLNQITAVSLLKYWSNLKKPQPSSKEQAVLSRLRHLKCRSCHLWTKASDNCRD